MTELKELYDNYEIITIDLRYNGADDGGAYLVELEDLVAVAVNQFRALHPDASVEINGVA